MVLVSGVITLNRFVNDFKTINGTVRKKMYVLTRLRSKKYLLTIHEKKVNKKSSVLQFRSCFNFQYFNFTYMNK